MDDVHLFDKSAASYNPDLRCQRNWFPMFLQSISIVHSNLYIIYKDFEEQNLCIHKHCTMAMIKALMDNANSIYRNSKE